MYSNFQWRTPIIAAQRILSYAAVGRLWRLDDAGRRETLALVARRLRPVAEFAAERGVRLAVEPLNRYETSLVNTVEQALALIEALDHPARGLLLDTFHLNIEEKRPAMAARFASSRSPRRTR